MEINLNSTLHTHLPEPLALAERALYYGDALFETIRVFDAGMPFLPNHWQRLHSGLRVLGFDIPDYWNADFFRREILRIAPANARVRLTVWRTPGGMYLPENNTPQFLIRATPLTTNTWEWPPTGVLLGVSDKVRLPQDACANLKTLNASRYGVAVREAADRGWDDALMLNGSERVCEATTSNIFWWEGGQLCTTLLSEGCVAGIMRNYILETAKAAGRLVQEKTAALTTLAGADEIFLTNAIRGIIPVRIFAERSLSTVKTRALFDLIKKTFGTPTVMK